MAEILVEGNRSASIGRSVNQFATNRSAWKRLFDGFLKQRAAATGEAFTPFEIDADYRRYVDGKPRYDGVAAFLKSRRIELPFGALEDGSDGRECVLERVVALYRTHYIEAGVLSAHIR